MRRRRRRPACWGLPYLPKGRDGKPTRWWWLKYKLPGDTAPRREPTHPKTDDVQEARRQLHERLGERDIVRVQREAVEDITVSTLLALVRADYEDKGQVLQRGRLEAWEAVLGPERALDVQRDHLDTICRRWRKTGPTWDGRDPKRIRPLDNGSLNRYVAALSRAYELGKEKRGLVTALTFPHYPEGKRGEYVTEDQCRAICANLQAKHGAAVKGDVFRIAYLLGIRKTQLCRTLKRHVLITGDMWKLKWTGEETKNGEPHEVVLVGEAKDIVQRAWANRLPDCDFLFHVNGKPLGPMRSEVRRTCEALGIPYGRGKGIVFHDTRHSAVTNLVGAGIPEVVAMTVTGHADPTVFKRYNVRRDDVQADALALQEQYLTQKRSTTPPILAPRRIRGTT
jgi:integrase